MSKLKIAFFTPLRPLKSGVSDYSEELLIHLKDFFDIDIIIGSNYLPENPLLQHFCNIIPYPQFQYELYDEIVYQFGCSLFHSYMLPFIHLYPGLTVLHDINQHLVYYLLGMNEDNSIYIQEMKYNYGEIGEQEAIEVLAGRKSPDIYGKPLLKRIIDNSKGLIVHSQFSKNKLLADFPEASVFWLPMAMPLDKTPNDNVNTIRNKFFIPNAVVISIPGFVAPTKRIYEFILAYKQAMSSFSENTMVLIIGPRFDTAYTTEINNLIIQLGLSQRIRFMGEVNEEDFSKLITLSDIIVNLRNPSVGETSSTIIRAMAAGKPSIVSKIGFFNELPDEACLKVRTDEHEIQDLKEALIHLVNNKSLRIQMGQSASRHSATVETLAVGYRDIIFSFGLKNKVSKGGGFMGLFTNLPYSDTFMYGEKELLYNQVPINNISERCIEVPIGIDFLIKHKFSRVLEVGNVLQSYLQEPITRDIVDKFEVSSGVLNVDLMEYNPTEKYDAIISVSTVEHIGQLKDPTGSYGEEDISRDKEGPLKAIIKIYNLLKKDGHALITVPFGKLMDLGWLIQFDDLYMQLLTKKYKMPEDELTIRYYKKVDMETTWTNPRQIWSHCSKEELINTIFSSPFPGSNGIAVLEINKKSDKEIFFDNTVLKFHSPYVIHSLYLNSPKPFYIPTNYDLEGWIPVQGIGAVFYGPYVHLAEGSYVFNLELEVDHPCDFVIEITSNLGTTKLLEYKVNNSIVLTDNLHLNNPEYNVEIRLINNTFLPQVTRVKVKTITLSKVNNG
ncbi:glycosyltransferase [Bacillus pseudomycoides]|uniref:Glycosyltransferase n=1 Tax=Bacillus bingmayongensis TaxID=1150157 RepID=A0ABU5JS82_9BACI|nr:glycosyltransferase [Bacillus pseudomycoides]